MEDTNNIRKHFVLVHGACFGAWIWYKVASLLKSSGQIVTALDMAASGLDPKAAEETKSMLDYSQPLIDFMNSLPEEERVVLVGHSLGGIPLSLAMEKFPRKIAVAVFLTAAMPGPDLPMELLHQAYEDQLGSVMDTKFIFGDGADKPPTSYFFGPEFLSTMLYQHSPPEDVELASLLVRPIAISAAKDSLEKNALTNENYDSVKRIYCIAGCDKLTNVDMQKLAVEQNPTDEVKTFHDSDHMTMTSCPKELSNYLLDVSKRYT